MKWLNHWLKILTNLLNDSYKSQHEIPILIIQEDKITLIKVLKIKIKNSNWQNIKISTPFKNEGQIKKKWHPTKCVSSQSKMATKGWINYSANHHMN